MSFRNFVYRIGCTGFLLICVNGVKLFEVFFFFIDERNDKNFLYWSGFQCFVLIATF